MSAANLMRRRGWTAQTIQPGQYMRISGREARNGVPMVLLGNISEVDPTDGSLVRVVEGESDYVEPVGASPLALTLSDGRPNFTGAWTMGPGGMGGGGMGMGGGPGGGAQIPYNEAGAAAAAAFDAISDPAVACEPPGLVRQAGSTPHPARMTQLDDRIILEYEEYGGRREILLDAQEPGDDVEHTNLGYSIARYDGDTLVIESSRLLENYTGPGGSPLSDQTTTVETYRRMDDPDIGAALAMEMVITDPAYLTGPWARNWLKYYTPEYEFIPVDCRVPPVYQPPE